MPSLLAVQSCSSINHQTDVTSKKDPADAATDITIKSVSSNKVDQMMMVLGEESQPDHESDNDDGKTIEISDTEHDMTDQTFAVNNPATTASTPTTTSRKHSTGASAPSSTRNSIKRKVTPLEELPSKKKQQTSVNQMTLANFFGKPSSSTTLTTPKAAGRRTNNNKSPPTDIPASPGCGKALSKSPDTDTKNVKRKSLDSKSQVTEQDNLSIACATMSTKNDTASGSGSIVEHQPINNDVDMNTKGSNKALIVTTTTMVGLDDKIQECTVESELPTKEGATKKSSSAKAPKTKMSVCKNPSTAKDVEVIEQADVQPPVLSLTEKDLSSERRSLNDKYRVMRELYLKRATGLVAQSRDGLVEERYEVPALQVIQDTNSHSSEECISNSDGEEFSTQVVANMVLLIEGSPLPLSSLANKICTKLEEFHGKKWPKEGVTAKIKLLARRKAHFESLISHMNESTAAISKTTTVAAAPERELFDLFEDTNLDRLWRWEVTTLDLLPPECVVNARKARSARRKVASNYSAILKLIKSLDDAVKMIFDPKLPNMDESIAKISRDEEKVLKFEREAEKLRLAEEAKARKLQELDAKKRAREEEAEERRRQKEDAAEERLRLKEEAARAREDAKRQKELEKEQKEAEIKAKEQLKHMNLTKQKASFKSFFAAPPQAFARVDKKLIDSPAVDRKQDKRGSFDIQAFRSMINNSKLVVYPSFATLSESAVQSRKRRTKDVSVSVYTTVTPVDEGWDAQPYAEQKTIKVPNKYRFLSFHEDCRPAYHGTWSKRSSCVTGRTPFSKDLSVFDYDYDSEAEWEEGDDEIGEDVEDEAKNQEEDEDEDGDAKMYDFNDGFCVADEQLLDHEEEADEETKALYKKKLQENHGQQLCSNRIRIIAPKLGGVPLDFSSQEPSGAVEGFDQSDVKDLLQSYAGVTLLDVKLCLDAFPQSNWDDENLPELPGSNTNLNKDEYTLAETIALARFVHHSTINSKERIIEELRKSNSSIFSIRAKATRKLDSIAMKKKHPKTPGLWYWEVRREFLLELGLTDLLEKKFEGADAVCADSAKEKASESTEQPQKPKRKAKEADAIDDSPVGKTKGSSKNKELGPANQAKAAPKDVSVGMKNLMTSFLKMASPKMSKTTGKATHRESTQDHHGQD